eukprot:PhM_4_TR12918/c0_g1_i1/m.4692
MSSLQSAVSSFLAASSPSIDDLNVVCSCVLAQSSPVLSLCRALTDSTAQQKFFGLLFRLQAARFRLVLNSNGEFSRDGCWEFSLLILTIPKEINHMRKIVVRTLCESNFPSLLLRVSAQCKEIVMNTFNVLHVLITFPEVYRDLSATSTLPLVAWPLGDKSLPLETHKLCVSTLQTVIEHYRKDAVLVNFAATDLASKLSRSCAHHTDETWVILIVSVVVNLARSINSAEVTEAIVKVLPACVCDTIQAMPKLDESKAREIFDQLQALSSVATLVKQPSSSSSNWSILARAVNSMVSNQSANSSTGRVYHASCVACIARIGQLRINDEGVQCIAITRVQDIVTANPQNYAAVRANEIIADLLKNIAQLSLPAQLLLLRVTETILKMPTSDGLEEIHSLLTAMHHALPAVTVLRSLVFLSNLFDTPRLVEKIADGGFLSVLHHMAMSVNEPSTLFITNCDEDWALLEQQVRETLSKFTSTPSGFKAVTSGNFVEGTLQLLSAEKTHSLARGYLNGIAAHCTNHVASVMVGFLKQCECLEHAVNVVAMLHHHTRLLALFLQYDGVHVLLELTEKTNRSIEGSGARLSGLLSGLLLSAPQQIEVLKLVDRISWTPEDVLACVTGHAMHENNGDAGFDCVIFPRVLNHVANIIDDFSNEHLEKLVRMLFRVPFAPSCLDAFHSAVVKLLARCEKKEDDVRSDWLRVLVMYSSVSAGRLDAGVAALSESQGAVEKFFTVAERSVNALVPHVIMLPHSIMKLKNIVFYDETMWPPPAGFSFSAWVRHHETSTSDGASPTPSIRLSWFADAKATATAEPHYMQLQLDNEKLEIIVKVSSSPKSFVVPGCHTPPGEWCHVIVTQNKNKLFSGEIIVYVNCIQVATFTESLSFGFGTSALASLPALEVSVSAGRNVLHFGSITVFDEVLTSAQISGSTIHHMVPHSNRTFTRISDMTVVPPNVCRWLAQQSLLQISTSNLALPRIPRSRVFAINPSCMTGSLAFVELSGRTRISPAVVEGLHAMPWYPLGSDVMQSLRCHRQFIDNIISMSATNSRVLKHLIAYLAQSPYNTKDVQVYQMLRSSLCQAKSCAQMWRDIMNSCDVELLEHEGKFIIVNGCVLENILLSREFVESLNDGDLVSMMKQIMSRWLVLNEPQSTFNATRLTNANLALRLVSALMTGPVRNPTVFVQLTELLKYHIVCGGLTYRDVHTWCGILTEIITCPRLRTRCVRYRDTVVNVFLRGMCSMAASNTNAFTAIMTKVCSPSWFLPFFQPAAHRVTKILAMQLFSVIVTEQAPFQYAVEKAHMFRTLRYVLGADVVGVDSNLMCILFAMSFGECLKLSDLDSGTVLLATRNIARASTAIVFPHAMSLMGHLMNMHAQTIRSSSFVSYFGNLPTRHERVRARWVLLFRFVQAARWWANLKGSWVSQRRDDSIVLPSETSVRELGSSQPMAPLVGALTKLIVENGGNDVVTCFYNPMFSTNIVDSFTSVLFMCTYQSPDNFSPLPSSLAAADRNNTSESQLFTSCDEDDDNCDSPRYRDPNSNTMDMPGDSNTIPLAHDLTSPPRDISPDLPSVVVENEQHDPAVSCLRDSLLEIQGVMMPQVLLVQRDNAPKELTQGSRFRYTSCALCLHHCLYNYPATAQPHAVAWLANTLINKWLSAIESRITVRTLLEDSAAKLIAANAVSVCEYIVDRVHAGGVTPISYLLKVISHMSSRFCEASLTEAVRSIRAVNQRAVLIILSQNYHKKDPAFLGTVLNQLVGVAPNVITVKNSSLEFLRTLSCRLFGLLDVVEVRGLTLVLFRVVLRVARESGMIEKLFVRTGSSGPSTPSSTVKKFDVFRGGLELLFFADNNIQFLKWYEAQKELPGENVFTFFSQVRTKYVAKEQRREIDLGKQFLYDVQMYRNKFVSDHEHIIEEGKKTWDNDLELRRTFVDTWVNPALLRTRVSTQTKFALAKKHVPLFADVTPLSHVIGEADHISELDVQDAVLSASHVSRSLALYVPETIFSYFPHHGFCVPDSVNSRFGPSVGPLPLSSQFLLSCIVPEGKVVGLFNMYRVVGICVVPVLGIISGNDFICVSYAQINPSGYITVTDETEHIVTTRKASKPKEPNWILRQIGLSRFHKRDESASTRDYSRALRGHVAAARNFATSSVWTYPLTSIDIMICRTFHHTHSGVEIKLRPNQHLFLVLADKACNLSESERERFLSLLTQACPHNDVRVATQKSQLIDLKNDTRAWQNGDLSTYEYLLRINSVAGRSFQDYNQYPVFPWVVRCDSSAEALDLQDEQQFRALARPMGAQDEVRAQEFRQRYEDWVDDSIPKFHYGSHYSSNAVVLYYKLRVQPNTRMSIMYQGGRLDVADRLFHSIREAWYSSSAGSRTDVKELIPEFFNCMSGGAHLMFSNVNDVALGVNRDGVTLGDVVLPSWASDAHAFLVRHREALESDFVSANIHNWFDLIFGVLQKGAEAEAALNVFHPLAYEEGVAQALSATESIEDVKAIVAHLDNFGTTPRMVFHEPHPRRIVKMSISSSQRLLNQARTISLRTLESSTAPFYVSHLAVCGHEILACSQTKIRVALENGVTSLVWSTANRVLRLADTIVMHTHDDVTALSVMTCGSLMCYGTALGAVCIYTRNTNGHYGLVSVNMGCHTDAVHHVSRITPAGTFYSLAGNQCCVWKATAMSNHLVSKIALDTTDKITAACCVGTIFVVVAQGTVLSVVSLTTDKVVARAAVEATHSSLTTLHTVNTRDWSSTFVILAGHKDGSITFIELSVDDLTLRAHTTVATGCSVAITALCDGIDINEFVVGFENGSVALCTFPLGASSSTSNGSFTAIPTNSSMILNAGSSFTSGGVSNGSLQLAATSGSSMIQSLADYVL